MVLSVEDVGVQWLLTELLNSHVKKDEGKASDAKWRATGLWLVGEFCSKSGANFESQVPMILKGTLIGSYVIRQ